MKTSIKRTSERKNYENYVEKFHAVDDISSVISLHKVCMCCQASESMITWKTETFRFVSHTDTRFESVFFLFLLPTRIP